MRNPTEVSKEISEDVQRRFSPALAMALGGSRTGGHEDLQSDLDLVVLLEEGPLFEQSRALNAILNDRMATPGALIGGPSWKEGFGCRTSVLYPDGFKLEIFVNTTDTIPTAERVLRWTPLWGARFLRDVQEGVAIRLEQPRLLAKAQFDVAYAHMSICRHLSRAELFAARHVLTNLVAIALALRLFELRKGYDPVSSYKRIQRDDLACDGVVVLIERAALACTGAAPELALALQALTQTCWQLLERMGAGQESAAMALAHARRIAAAAEAWLKGEPAHVACCGAI